MESPRESEKKEPTMEPKSKKRKIIPEKNKQTLKLGREFRSELKTAEDMVAKTRTKMRDQRARTEAYNAAKYVAQHWGKEWGGDLATMESAIHKDDIIVPQAEKEKAYDYVFNHADLSFRMYRHVRGIGPQHRDQDVEDRQRVQHLKDIVRGWV
jgi:hypothetical protein